VFIAAGANYPVDLEFPVWEPDGLRVVSEKRLREFIALEPRAAGAMRRWVDVV
jgi:hypothetical protein